MRRSSTLEQHRGNAVWLVVLTTTVLLLSACSLGEKGVDYSFRDEFDGPAGAAPDPRKWSHDLGGGGWGNEELQVYTASRSNSFLDGRGHLVIRATRDAGGGSYPSTTYHSARLTTLGRFAQERGHWEARIKVDIKRGLWPAWWLLGENYPLVGWPQCGEVDIFENYGFSAVESSVHVAGETPSGYNSFSAGTSIDRDFHVYRLAWSDAGMFFSIDGRRYAELHWEPAAENSRFDPGQPMFMLLNLAVGGRVGPPPESVAFPVDLVVDYVRVWR